MRIEDVKSLLPPTVHIICGLIGMPSTLRLVEELGGTTFPVSKNKTRQGEIRYEVLAETVGVEAADKLTEAFGGVALYIPVCADALRRIRDLTICAQFDEQCKAVGSITAVAKLARDHRLSDRRVWDILKHTSTEAEPDDASDLFGFSQPSN